MSRKRTVALVGADTIIGKALVALNCFHRTINHEGAIPWNNPFRAKQIITKGQPEVYISCYSHLDHIESNLGSIMKTVVEAAKPTKAIVMGFSSYKVFADSPHAIDERQEPSPFCESGALQVIHESIITRAIHPIVFRLGNVVTHQGGLLEKVVKSVLLEDKKLETNNYYSLTTAELLLSAVRKAIDFEFIGTFHLSHLGGLSQRLLWDYLVTLHNFPQVKGQEREPATNRILDNSKWNALSMTTVCDWQTALIPYSDQIKKLHGLKK